MDRDKIRAAAEKATKGPWECYKDHVEGKWFDVRNNDVKIVSPHAHKGCEDDFNFIALADPDTVITLLNALDSAEKSKKELDFTKGTLVQYFGENKWGWSADVVLEIISHTHFDEIELQEAIEAKAQKGSKTEQPKNNT